MNELQKLHQQVHDSRELDRRLLQTIYGQTLGYCDDGESIDKIYKSLAQANERWRSLFATKPPYSDVDGSAQLEALMDHLDNLDRLTGE